MARIGNLSAELDRCGAHNGSFWKKFVNLMVPEQKTQLAKEPHFILFLTHTLSDPGVEFGFSVLARMSPR